LTETPGLLFRDLSTASDQMLSVMSEIMGINTFFVAVNDSRTNFVLRALNRGEILVTEESRPFHEAYCSLVVDTEDDILIIPDITSDPATRNMQITDELGRASFIGVPIQLRDGKKIGTVCGMDRRPYAFSKVEIALLKSMATFLARAFELENATFRDQVTQAFNRNYLDMCFAGNWKDKFQSIGVLFIDFDNFKTVNDSYDHSLGDDVLRAVTEKVRKGIRADDILCRIGGDEFVVLVLNYEQEHTLIRIIEQIQAELEKPLDTSVGEISISASIGLSRYPLDGTEIRDLIKKADRAMYEVKRAGRNNYSFYSSKTGSSREE